jgi:hypothetical protein
MLVDFDNIADSSRIWIYGAEQKLINEQEVYILKFFSDHLQGWNSHGSPLKAAVTILSNHFIVVALDESENEASGCSIDRLQNIIQEIEKELSISLLNRLNIFCSINDEIKCIPTFKLNDIAKNNTLFYDLTIQKKSDVYSYLKPVSEGWCAYLIK